MLHALPPRPHAPQAAPRRTRTHPPPPPLPRLRDDARKDGGVLSYLRAENEYTDAVLADTKELQVGGWGVLSWLRGREKQWEWEWK